MEILSGTALEAAFQFCDQHPGARVGIACASVQTAGALIDALWEEITNGRMTGWEMGKAVGICGESKLIRRTKTELSFIEIFAPSYVEHVCGRSYHKVLYEKHMPDSLVQELSWIERLPPICGEVVEDDGKELDEFLNSFKIL